jgi:hypothetical protein
MVQRVIVDDGFRTGLIDVLRVFDLLGREIIVLAEGHHEPGEHAVIWDGRNKSGEAVGGGVYLYRLTAGGQVMTRTMLLLK